MALGVEVRVTEARPAAVINYKTTQEELGQSIGAKMGAIAGYIQQHGGRFAGPPFVVYNDVSGAEWAITVGFPVFGPVVAEGEIVPGEQPGGRVATTMHVGPYERLGETWTALEGWLRAQALHTGATCWEVYETDPDAEPDPSKWKTQLFWSLE
ncbi:MAG: GyrI-like domain-containing protein [Anaerolineae bacterium]|nr:GyrI-like domain-containing protein [Anaerolineae bacterium]